MIPVHAHSILRKPRAARPRRGLSGAARERSVARRGSHAALSLALLLTLAARAGAQYDVDWYVIAAGESATRSAPPFELAGTIGQPVASAEAAMVGGPYAFRGGFWVGSVPPCAYAGDVDGDGAVDLADLASLLSGFGACAGDAAYGEPLDINASGCIDLADLAILLSTFGEACP